MRWIKDPYLGPLVKRKKETLIRDMEEGSYPSGVYVIMLSLNGKDYLDIRKAGSFTHAYIQEADPLIAGLAANKREALAIVEKMASDCFKERQDADLRAFITDRQERTGC